MFRAVEDGEGRDVFAFVDNADVVVREDKNSGWSFYSMKAFWFVSSGATEGALAYGDVIFSFNNYFAPLLNAREDYRDLSVEEIFELAGREKKLPAEREIQREESRGGNYVHHFTTKGKDVASRAHALFGLGVTWNDHDPRDSERGDQVFKELVDTWFALPDMPEGTSRWMKYSKR